MDCMPSTTNLLLEKLDTPNLLLIRKPSTLSCIHIQQEKFPIPSSTFTQHNHHLCEMTNDLGKTQTYALAWDNCEFFLTPT